MENQNNDNNLAIYHFLETQLQLFKGHFLITQASMDEEAIHQMRVAIKRIRTIQKLKKHINFPTIIDDEQYNSIKTIFAVSGNLRDLQIQQTLLKRYIKLLKSPFQEMVTYLSDQDHLLTEKLNTTIRNTDFASFLEIPEPEDSLENIKDNSDLRVESLDFLKKKTEKIFKLNYQLDKKDDFVHDMRKQIKQLFFILQFLHNHFPDNETSDFELKNIKDVGERIGDWNDRDVFELMLNNFISKQKGSFIKDYAEYRILQYVIEDEKRKFLQDIATDIYIELMKLKIIIDYQQSNVEDLEPKVISN